uniref:Uncharacterized protein n=2 Tax=Oryza sativa subsp. japonica TaxID=39947 RepID=Q7G2L1_ORYSJ|nr:hypothetical protein [Oryza sativa Japonica Group]AAP54309.1 hypothetical protein LOC_Os10g34057 [Oryza sativa Japonica Group]
MERYMLKGPLQVVGFVWETGFGRDGFFWVIWLFSMRFYMKRGG